MKSHEPRDSQHFLKSFKLTNICVNHGTIQTGSKKYLSLSVDYRTYFFRNKVPWGTVEGEGHRLSVPCGMKGAWLGISCKQGGSSIVGTDAAVGGEPNEWRTVYTHGRCALPHSETASRLCERQGLYVREQQHEWSFVWLFLREVEIISWVFWY